MKTSFITQPVGIGGTPQTFGSILSTEILSTAYSRIEIWVAYATASGTSRLYGPLHDFIDKGGIGTVHVGLSNGVTSVQAVDHLLRAGVSVFGFETGGSVLFHPKVYLLIGSAKYWISVGSSNLTESGLYRNVETNSVTTGDLTDRTDYVALLGVTDTLDVLRQMADHCRPIVTNDLSRLVNTGSLLDETVSAPDQHTSTQPTQAGKTFPVPAAPPPHPDLGTSPEHQLPLREPTNTPPLHHAQYFAMTLSAFDTSHRVGVGGTPEVSLPEDTVGFFPTVSLQGRKYPDAYFDVLLNERRGTTRSVRYRIWQRPPGSGSGHADWRINVRHDTIEQTREGGGDILMIQRVLAGSRAAYEAWVVQPADPEYHSILGRCNRSVQARSTAGTKRYGIF